jgi:transposase
MRAGIFITLSPANRKRLVALVEDRNAAQKHVWRAEIVLRSADGVGTNEIMRRTGKSKTCIWRWQERFMQEGFDGRPSRATERQRCSPPNVLDGTVIGRNMQRHRHQEFIRFLNAIGAELPAGKVVHVLLDNYAAHKHPKVRQWLDRHERFIFHFTPTSCSWLNAVEGFFAKLTKRRLKRGVFRSVAHLQAAINRFLLEHNGDAKPFTWTADPDKIIAAVRRGHQALDSIH